MTDLNKFVTTTLCGFALLAMSGTNAVATTIFATGFEPPDYVLGNLDGQQGWSTPVGPADRVRVRDDVPSVGAQALWAASGGGGVSGTGAFHDLSTKLTGKILTVSSRVVFTTGTRSDWEVNSVFGTGGFIGGLRVLGDDQYSIETSLGSTATGVFHTGFPTLDLQFDFQTAMIAAFVDGLEIISGVAFDATNDFLAQVAAINLITPRFDAIAVDEFSVTLVPEPMTVLLLATGIAGVGFARRRDR